MRGEQAQTAFHGELLKSLISGRGGVEWLLDAWHAQFGDCHTELRVPDRSTIYRWMNGKWPRTSNQLLALAHLLAVDPFCLFDMSESTAPSTFSSLYKCYSEHRWNPPVLSFLQYYFGHQRDWPPPVDCDVLPARRWIVREISHIEGQRGGAYRSLAIVNLGDQSLDMPQVYHFAYRHPLLFDQQWIEYGFIVRQLLTARLVSINGHVQSVSLATSDNQTRVETWFGPSPTIFRIASLHDFAVELTAPDENEGGQLRFPI